MDGDGKYTQQNPWGVSMKDGPPEPIIEKPTIEQPTKLALIEKEIKESQAIQVYDIIDSGRPDEVIKRKHEMAKVLQDIVNKRQDGLEVNGKRVLNYEEWLMISKMHQCVPRVVRIDYTLQKYGSMSFEAYAELVHVPTGKIVGGAEGMAEKTEKGKDWMSLNQIKSLAQTRACSKACRMAFGDIAVLAGYTPTPLEEIDETALVTRATPKLKNMIK